MPEGSVLVTGSSTGIGEACALHLDSLGFRVFAGVRREADADKLREKSSDRLRPLILDVTDQATIAASAKIVEEESPSGLAGLVNNAGIVVAAPLEFVPMEDLRRQFEVNVIGQIAVTQAFVAHVRKARGRVVNIGSVGGLVSGPFIGPYSASKFAMEALTDALRIELKPWGIKVAIIEPGNIATPIWQKSLKAADDLRSRVSPESEELYGPEIEAMYKYSEKQDSSGIPPIQVAKAVAHALTATKPRTRYLVGADAKIQARIARRFPDRLRDNLIMREVGFNRKAKR